MCWLHDMIHLATVTLQESRQFGGFVKGGPKSSLRPFLHQALQLVNWYSILINTIRGRYVLIVQYIHEDI